MKVLLVRPQQNENVNTRLPKSMNEAQGVYPPLGLAYIAACLEQVNYPVKIVDCQALNLTTSEYRELIESESPDLVGVTCMTPTVRASLEAARIAKEFNPKTITVLGGPHLSVYPQTVSLLPFVDFGVRGDGEQAMLELLRALEGSKSFSEVPGLIYKENGVLRENGVAILRDLDTLPLPSRHLIPNAKYSCIIAKRPMTTMITSRGCPFHCAFCFKLETDKHVRFRSALSVVDEMEHCVKAYGIRHIMFYDDSFTMKRSHFSAICREIIRRNLKVEWEAPTRVDLNIDEESLSLLKEAGCVRLRFGVESGNAEILKAMRKGFDKQQARRAFKLTRKYGIETFAYFMVGYADENEATIQETISFVKELDPDWAMFTAATPLPGTNLHDEAVDRGLVAEDYWLNFTLSGVKERIPYFVPNCEEWVKRAYRKFYLRPGFVWRKLRNLRSLDALRKYYSGFKSIALFEMK